MKSKKWRPISLRDLRLIPLNSYQTYLLHINFYYFVKT